METNAQQEALKRQTKETTDAPYAFALRKGTQGDVVLTVKGTFETDVLTILESPQLGIKLVATAEDPEPQPPAER